jgi:hypothetical protein
MTTIFSLEDIRVDIGLTLSPTRMHVEERDARENRLRWKRIVTNSMNSTVPS